MKQFKALMFEGGTSEPYIGDAVVREPKGTEVLVRLLAAGICHSDLHVLHGDNPATERIVLGHEGAGIVEAIGPDVTAVGLGDQVVMSWWAPCGICANCKNAREWLCQDTKALQNTLPDGTSPLVGADGESLKPFLGVGAYAEYTLVPQAAVVKVPHSVPSSVAALIGCSVTTGIGAVLNTAEFRAGQTAVVVGCGGVGQSVIMGLKLAGAAEIIAVDLSEDRLDQARLVGATHVVNPGAVDSVEAVLARVPNGVDFAFDAIGRPQTIPTLLPMVRSGGAGVVVGLPPREEEIGIKVWEMVVTGKRLLGCYYGSSRPQVDFPKMIDLYLAGMLDIESLIGEEVPLEQAAAGVKGLERAIGKRKIVRFGI
ncbi:Alcohol dehydrogenase [Leucobacter sp. 7(1)]|uniref:zinc-binding dehydrogenase n=1 Tax=Leucobacter sp. 7(1) TaxID=1255613 RepID=UPI00097E8780|nr:alcohol dehydrogenase catalytic domain-containing protein [Leucobacter sp. 7(1)]SJN09364.1 Alcohol dehydrogenase [Leucobacter sp. 7(1)]